MTRLRPCRPFRGQARTRIHLKLGIVALAFAMSASAQMAHPLGCQTAYWITRTDREEYSSSAIKMAFRRRRSSTWELR